MDKCAEVAKMASRDNLDRVNAASKPVKPKNTFYTHYVKRVLDIAISLPAFIITLPVNLALGIGTFLDVGTPIFFKQERLGKDNELFTLVKFRNMTNETDEQGNLLPASERTTKFGRFVRKYSLDELLNFWFVLNGKMSIIGPRPLPIDFLPRYSYRHCMRTSVKPGLECPTIGSDGHVRLYQEQFENDIWYVENASFIVDCKMLVALFGMVFNKRERSDHSAVGGGYFVGYDSNGIAFSMRRIPHEYEEEFEKLNQDSVLDIDCYEQMEQQEERLVAEGAPAKG